MYPAYYKNCKIKGTNAHPDQEATSTPQPASAASTLWPTTKSDITTGPSTPDLPPTGPQVDAELLQVNTPTQPSRETHVIYDPAFAYFPRFEWSGTHEVAFEDETTPRPIEQRVYPYPNLTVPQPSLKLDFRMSIKLGERILVGSSPLGRQTWITFTGGSWSGSWGTGIVLPGGRDSETITSNGSTRLDAKFLLQTHEAEPAYISVKARGWTTGPVDVLAKLSDSSTIDSVDPSSYSFKLSIGLETADDRYKDKVNCGMWVGSGMKRCSEIIFDAYRVC